MDIIIESLKSMSDAEAREYITMLFQGYINRKKENRVFDESIRIPKIIILTYYTCVENNLLENIYEIFKDKYIETKNFKERYLYNENKLEHVHSREEEQGLRLVYDYIQKKNDYDDISIYTLSDIHEILYSRTPHPEFGGKYRTDERYLPNSGIDVVSPSLIVHEMNYLKPKINSLIEEGKKLGKEKQPEKIIEYIDKCLEVKCELIKIHPFGDGNGRSIRAFLNLLFRLANIPPVYIENKERDRYGVAMQKAVGDGDISLLKQLYYNKICDSIISLDITIKNLNNEQGSKKI